MSDVKQEVRQFYDRVGWQLVGDDIYQNARFEDLRPVTQEYIHRCHLRVARYLKPQGKYLLDAGSGPIQYLEYLEYSRDFQRRVCADISITALIEARKRLGERGLYVVTDVANLPFKAEAFDGVVSLHTIHHLPEEEHLQAYRELYRVLAPHSSAAVVNGWPASRLMNIFNPLIRLAHRLRNATYRLQGKSAPAPKQKKIKKQRQEGEDDPTHLRGTFTNRHDVAWMKEEVGRWIPLEIMVWRSVSVRFLRALIHPWLGGRWIMRLIFWLEERFPHYFGECGQYPLIVLRKP